MTHTLYTPSRQPDGWHCGITFTHEGVSYYREPRLVQTEAPTEAQLSALVEQQQIFVELEIAQSTSPITTPNESLASLAIAAKAILDKSPKLQSLEIQGLLDQLVSGVKSVANANPADGEAATSIVNKMLDDPQLQAQPDLS